MTQANISAAFFSNAAEGDYDASPGTTQWMLTSSEEAEATAVAATSGAAEFAPDSGHPLFLHLRYYARHFIPIFCAVGIIGNCMALLLIRQVPLEISN
jgi:hypothetical protein